MAIGHERMEQYLSATKLGRRLVAHPFSQYIPLAPLALGLALGAAALIRYDRHGYSHWVLWLWLASFAVLGAFFITRSRAFPRIATLDLVMPPVLALLFAPLYLAAVYHWPVQVSSDEVVVTQVSAEYGTKAGVDIFGTSTQLGRPALLYVVWGNLAELLGGIDLYHVRLLHGLFGLILIAASYALFRQVLPRNWAIFATCVLGVSHALFMISRIALRENTAVLAEVVAFALLLWGLRHNNAFATFCGGSAAGLGWYVYYPSRAIFPLWVVFLLALALLQRRSFPVRKLLSAASIAAVGFVLIAAPILIAESKENPHGVYTAPNRETLMIYPEARLLQRGWVFAPTVWEGWKTNIEHGLGVFNNGVIDNGWIYQNPGHGFVDPLTGILLWLGVGVVGWRLLRRRVEAGPLLLLGSFFAFWLSFAFLVNKAPNYSRMLIILPLVAYLVAEAAQWLSGRWSSVPRASISIMVALAGVIAVWNLAIAWDFIQDGRRTGDSIGSTGRYVTSHAGTPGIHFYMSADDSGNYNYYDWGNATSPRERMGLFVADKSLIGEPSPVLPQELRNFSAPPPFALFMRRTLWLTVATDLADRYPHSRLRNMTPTGTHVVLEVPRS